MMNRHDMHTASRPLGYWLKAVDRLLAAEFARAFEAEGASRRDWRLLNAVDGTVAPRRPLNGHRLHRLIERGWVARTDDGFALTDDGRAAKERLGDIVSGIRARVSDAVPPEDLATTLASLEQIARALGWSEDAPLPHGRTGRGHARHGHGRHGRGGHRGFGPHGRRHAHREHGRGDGFLKVARFGQRSYERGFEAGFARGRDA